MFSHAYSSRFYSDGVLSKQQLLSAHGWASCTRAVGAPITSQHVCLEVGRAVCVVTRGRGLTGHERHVDVCVSVQHGCHSGFVSWWNCVPESCVRMTAKMRIWYRALQRPRVRRLHTANAEQTSEQTTSNSSTYSSFSVCFSIFLFVSFCHPYKSRRKSLSSSFILMFPTALHFVCWPSYPHLEGEAWGTGISG